jgi:hypothetical protein
MGRAVHNVMVRKRASPELKTSKENQTTKPPETLTTKCDGLKNEKNAGYAILSNKY